MGNPTETTESWNPWIVYVVTAGGNLFGAVLTYLYFTFIDAQLDEHVHAGAADVGLPYFIIGTTSILVVLFLGNTRRFRRLQADMKAVSPYLGKDPEEGDLAKLRDIVGRLMNLPSRMAGVSVLGWALAAFVFGALPVVLLPDSSRGQLSTNFRVTFGILFVGGPMTLITIYFLLERILRSRVKSYFPRAALLQTPQCVRTRVLPKMLLVSIFVGTVPVTVISVATISQIEAVEAGRQSLASFTDKMPIVIGCLLAWAIAVAVALSLFLARSISAPLQTARNAMNRIGNGELNVSIPVVSNDEIGIMGEGFNRMVEGLKERDFIRDTFGRYVSKEVAAEILNSLAKLDPKGALRDISILVSDLRGFTTMAASMEPREVLGILNHYFEAMTDVIEKHNGTIDEFTGDGILVFFGAPQELGDHPERAVACALDMQRAMESLNRANSDSGAPELAMGIGITSGELVVGNIGSDKRRKYGAVGSPINVAFRIEAQTAGGEILVSPETRSRLKGRLEVASERQVFLKGFSDPVTLSLVGGLTPSGPDSRSS